MGFHRYVMDNEPGKYSVAPGSNPEPYVRSADLIDPKDLLLGPAADRLRRNIPLRIKYRDSAAYRNSQTPCDVLGRLLVAVEAILPMACQAEILYPTLSNGYTLRFNRERGDTTCFTSISASRCKDERPKHKLVDDHSHMRVLDWSDSAMVVWKAMAQFRISTRLPRGIAWCGHSSAYRWCMADLSSLKG